MKGELRYKFRSTIDLLLFVSIINWFGQTDRLFEMLGFWVLGSVISLVIGSAINNYKHKKDIYEN